MTDAQLLECFVQRRDEAAFEALMHLHARMVFGVCYRILGHHQDAEEAFQATFLVLAQKAASLSGQRTLANWLYGVALRISRKAKGLRAVRRVREHAMTPATEPTEVPARESWSEFVPFLDDELSRLPEKYRTSIILCDLEGKAHKDVGRLLGLAEATISSRVMRGRHMLAKRLARRGTVLTIGGLATLLSQDVASAGVPQSVMDSVVEATRIATARQAATAGVISTKAAVLTEGALRAMYITNPMKIGAAALLVVSTGIGAGGMIYQMQAAEPTITVEDSIAQVDASRRKVAEETNRKQSEALTRKQEVQQAKVKYQLKELIAAMYGYNDVHGHLPPAVVYGKDGKGTVPHSWRVELLPYLDQTELYNQYNFDEPWDSDTNKKVLAKMPDVFRHPMAPNDSTNASYFVLVGKLLDKVAKNGELETPFSLKGGAEFKEITDGLSNTIGVVEAKRDIPWTKPEDIPYDPKKDVPKLGGWFPETFTAACLFYAVVPLSTTMDVKLLRNYIGPQDGVLVPILK